MKTNLYNSISKAERDLKNYTGPFFYELEYNESEVDNYRYIASKLQLLLSNLSIELGNLALGIELLSNLDGVTTDEFEGQANQIMVDLQEARKLLDLMN